MRWFNRIMDRFILQLRIDYVNRAINDIDMVQKDNGEAQVHLNNAKDELYRASNILTGKKEELLK